jgi:hypothetical protein
MRIITPKIPHCLLLLLCIAAACWPFAKTVAQQHSPITVVYEISVEKNKNKAGIEETYNGGTRVVFASGTKARVRLVTLMRIQSIFLEYDTAVKKATVIKESGKDKYLFRLAPAQWKEYNKKYDSLICDTSYTDSANIKGYPCRKAVIKTGDEDEDEVTVFYTDSIKMDNSIIEPLFRCINGTVLQYEISTSKGTMRFTAAEVSTAAIDPKIFTIPSKGVAVKKYSPNKKAEKETEPVEEDE